MVQNRILVVDDEPAIRFGIRRYLEAAGYIVDEADTFFAATAACRRTRPDAAIVDYNLPDGNGVDLIDRLLGTAPDVPVIMLTAHGSIDLAVSAVRHGATTLLTKPVRLPALLSVVQQSIAGATAPRPRPLAKASTPLNPFLGTSAAIKAVERAVARIEHTRSPVLILGETGTGKGVLARWLHRSSGRAFVDLNCAGLSEALIDSEIFGHVKGSFTGAVADKPGLLEEADGGTIFLDEIGDMPPTVQGKLLKVLEEKRFRRLGELRDRSVDVRLIAATHCPLQRLVREEKFRADLYYRIATFPITLPPLRQRTEDIPHIARALLDKASAAHGSEPVELAPSAIAALSRHAWPGNLRELRNVLERAVVGVSPSESRIEAEHLAIDDGAAWEAEAPSSVRSQTLRAAERERIEEVLRSTGGRVDEASRILGVPRSSLYVKIRKYGLSTKG